MASQSSGLGIWTRSSWVLHLGSHVAVVKALARAGVAPELQVLVQAYVVLGTIPFPAAVEVLVACFFKASQRLCCHGLL